MTFPVAFSVFDSVNGDSGFGATLTIEFDAADQTAATEIVQSMLTSTIAEVSVSVEL
jgi:hypothetical protein